MAMFASLSHNKHHRRWQCLPLSYIHHHTRAVCLLFVLHHTNGSVGLCVLYSTYNTAVLTFSIQFKNHTPIGCNKASTWIKRKLNIKHIFSLFCAVFKTLCFQSLFSVWYTQYHTSKITDQIRQDGWAYVRILNFTGGLMSDEPMSGGLLLKSVGWYSSDLNLYIKYSRRVPTVQPFL